MSNERRQHERKPWVSGISYRISSDDLRESDRLSLKGRILDISASGLSISTDHMLQPGLVITFGQTGLAGIVKWSSESDNSYSAGVQLI
jgi:hypothetical protein